MSPNDTEASPSKPAAPTNDADLAVGEVNLAQIMAELRKGEKTADVLESSLKSLEKKIDDLLASVEEADRTETEVPETKTVEHVSQDQKSNADKKP